MNIIIYSFIHFLFVYLLLYIYYPQSKLVQAKKPPKYIPNYSTAKFIHWCNSDPSYLTDDEEDDFIIISFIVHSVHFCFSINFKNPFNFSPLCELMAAQSFRQLSNLVVDSLGYEARIEAFQRFSSVHVYWFEHDWIEE